LETYVKRQQLQTAEEMVFKKGPVRAVLPSLLSQRRGVPETFGLSPSTLSWQFVQSSVKELRELLEWDLCGYDLVALFMGGKTFATDEMIIALGLTLTGDKVIFPKYYSPLIMKYPIRVEW
jgi:hypothetical protein